MKKEFTIEYEKFNELTSDEKRFNCLNNIYNYFTNLTEKDKEVWDVKVLDEGISEIIEVRLFTTQSDYTEIPLFRFHSDKFRSSFDKLNTPFQFVEINTDIDSEKNSCNHWLVEMNEEKNIASVTSKPTDIFLSSSDLDSGLNILQTHSPEKSRELFRDFLKEVEVSTSGVVVPDVNSLLESPKLYKHLYKSIPDKDVKSALKYYYNLNIDSNRSGSTKAFVYLLTASKDAQKKFILKTAAIAGGGLLAVGLLIKGVQIFEQDFEGRTKELQIGHQLSEYEDLAKDLEGKGESKFLNYINTIILLSKKWGVEPKELGVSLNKYREGLDKYLYSDSSERNLLEIENLDLEALISSLDVSLAVGDKPFNGNEKITKRVIRSMLEIFPFLKSGINKQTKVVLDSNLTGTESYQHTELGFRQEIVIPPCFGNQFTPMHIQSPKIDSSTALTFIIKLHEITHSFNKLDFNKIISSISPESLALLAHYKYQIADDMVTDWAQSKSNEKLFTQWFLDSADIDSAEMLNIIHDFEPDNIQLLDDNELNLFIQRIVTKRLDILNQVERGEVLSSDDNEFMFKYYKYDLGNKIVTHVLHILEDIVPEPLLSNNTYGKSIINMYLEKYLEYIAKTLLGKTSEEVVKEINQKVFGTDLEFKGELPEIFNSLSKSNYISAYSADGHQVSIGSNKGVIIVLDHDTNELICMPEDDFELTDFYFSTENTNSNGEAYLAFNNKTLLKRSDDGVLLDSSGKPAIVCERVGLNPEIKVEIVMMPEKGDKLGIFNQTVIVTVDQKGNKEYFIQRNEVISDLSQIQILSEGNSPRLLVIKVGNNTTLALPYDKHLEHGIEIRDFSLVKNESSLNLSIGNVGYLLSQENFDKLLVDKPNIVESRVRYKVEENQLVPELMYKRPGDKNWVIMELNNPQYYSGKG